jgi:hypothetical protein
MKTLLQNIYSSIPFVRQLGLIRNHLANIDRELSLLRMASFRKYLDTDLSQQPRFCDPKRLLKYAWQVNSQNGEDGMIDEIFRRIGTTNREFIEIGVGDGRENNTAFLLSQGWSGIWIDADPAFAQCVAQRPDIQPHLKTFVTTVNRDNIVDLLERARAPKTFDLLSIDIDQNTYFIWEALNNYSPRVVVIEYNANLPAHKEYVCRYDPRRVWDGSCNLGASLKSLEILGARMGYSLVGCDLIGLNAFFVQMNFCKDHFVSPFTADNHYEPPRFGWLHRAGHRPTLLDRGNHL